jgi:hypothetical protein
MEKERKKFVGYFGRFKFTLQIAVHKSKEDNLHIPLLYIGLNKKGFGITILGIYFSLFWL